MFGTAIGLVALIIAYILKNTPFQILALILIALSSLTIFPYLSMRYEALDRIEKVYRIESPTRADDFKKNTANRKGHLWLYLVTSILAGVTAMIGPRRNRLGLIVGIMCILFGVGTIQYSMWMHYQDALYSQPHLKKSVSPVHQRLKDKTPNS